MLHKRILEQMLDFHRTTLENSFSITTMLQCQAENILNFFRHYSGMNDEAKKVMDKRIREYKKGIDDLKKAMDNGCAVVEDFYNNHPLAVFHQQTARILKLYLDQAKCMPPEMKKTMEELAATYKAGCDTFRKFIDKNMWCVKNDSHNAAGPLIKKEQTKSPSSRSVRKSHP
mgnify:CR=1 FL=1